MPKPFHQLTVEQFVELLEKFPFTRKIESVHMHHTWRPNHSQYNGTFDHRIDVGVSHEDQGLVGHRAAYLDRPGWQHLDRTQLESAAGQRERV